MRALKMEASLCRLNAINLKIYILRILYKIIQSAKVAEGSRNRQQSDSVLVQIRTLAFSILKELFLF
ncbi:MAG: hypothetical protein AAY43_10385 [Methanosarcina sp. 795]|nr:MAG: hypothetical protein AAY43_10385 [Methanosarcina sp. 795]